MVTFNNFTPTPEQTDVARTSLVSFNIVENTVAVDINTLSLTIEGTQVISAGTFINGYTGNIYHLTNKYFVGVYPKSPFFSSAAEIPVLINIRDINGTLDSYGYSFYISGYGSVEESIPSSPTRSCQLGFPYFTTDLGLIAALDNGNGTEVSLDWKQAYPYNENNVVFYNIYYASKRVNVLDGYPDFISSDIGTTINGLVPGDTHFFSIRATEYNPNVFTISGMTEATEDLYYYPTSTLDGYINATATLIPANTNGFPNFGVILIDTEYIRYSSISGLGFIVSSRSYGGTTASIHYSGSSITLYKGREESNTIIAQATPTFQKPNYALTYILGDGYGPDGYRDGYDGYAHSDGYLRFKQENIDSLTTNGDENNASGEFNRFDYCGTWRSMSPSSIMRGQCRRSYFGGAQVRIDDDGNRHLVKVSDVQTHMLQREELLLETTGESFVLLRRMWTGMRCSCFMMRREHPDARCPLCYGIGFTQGFIQFFNPRRSDRRILVRIDPATDDLTIVDRGGLEPVYEPSGWTLPFPQIKDRDILIRFNNDNTEAWRYEILNVTRNKVLFTQVGAQKLTLKRLPKTSIIYQFPVVRDTSPLPDSITTSISNTPGIIPHSHSIILPYGENLTTFKGATLESEGHNHVIYVGKVQNVLNHTHTL